MNYPMIIFNVFLVIILIDLSICDIQSFRIPNEDNLLILFLGLLRLSLCNSEEGVSHLLGLFLLSVPLLFVALIRKGTLGGGDIKLLGAAGLYLGSPVIIYAAFMGFSLAAIYSIALLIAKKKGPGDRIPIGPFLSVGIILALFL